MFVDDESADDHQPLKEGGSDPALPVTAGGISSTGTAVTLAFLVQEIPELSTTGVFFKYDSSMQKLVYTDVDGDERYVDLFA